MKYLLLVIIACFSQCSANYGYPPYEPRYGFPMNKNINYTFKTYVPVPLNSQYVDQISITPFKVLVNASAVLQTRNIGNQVYTYMNSSETVGNVVTFSGGPCYNETYKFSILSFTLDGFCGEGSRAGTLEDGKGYPVQFRIVGYNSKYPRIYPDAVQHRDGVLIINVNVEVTSQPNYYFPPFEKVLHAVSQDNATATCTAVDAMAWLLQPVSGTRGYYVYPGSYLTQEFGQQECATMVHPSFNVHPKISYKQFRAFTNVMSKLGKQVQNMANPLGVYELNQRPVCRASRSSYFDVRWYK